jgi:hypothetical protein
LEKGQQAVANKAVIWRGKSAVAGLWDSVPPPFPLVKEEMCRTAASHCSECESSVDNPHVNSHKNEVVKITETHLKWGHKIAKLAS